jgi:Zn-dependent membrane protease YugP
MAKLKPLSPVLLMADESIHSPRDAELMCRTDACHVVNIKLMKCGGIYPALQIADVAKRYGKPCILGCMSETKLGIAAGASVVAARADQMGVVDLDSFLNFADTGAGVSGGLTVERDVIRLSDNVYANTSAAAIGVACHEAGHAVQYAQNYAPIKLRAAIVPITNIGSILAMPLILLGLVLNVMTEFSYTFVYIGIACFWLSLLFQLITLPVEFNASRRAVSAISGAGLLDGQELEGAKKTLRAAALTYVAAAAVSLMQLLRLILIFGGRRDD